jgi:RNA polymerase sigma-70 factor (ECF subfamily)
MTQPGDGGARAAAEAVARRSYGRLVALLAARTRDVAGAEDALSEAFAAALADWPAHGVPRSPEAWLSAVARRKWIDATRRRRSADGAADHLRLMAEEIEAAASGDAALPDERLSLMFACAHPAIDAGVRAPLILQTILGFDAARIGSAFLVSPAAMAQRLVRAKKKIREAGIPLRRPEPCELAPRLGAVLDAIYAAFGEAWSDPAGSDVRGRDLADEAIWLGRLVASLLPDEPEALGLLSLMLYAQARRDARRDRRGDFVPLSDQDPSAWDARLIGEAEALLARASALPGTGRFQLEAAVQSAHVVRRVTGRSDWPAIERLYDALLELTGSPVVGVNRAVALSETRGVEAGLEALDALADDRRLADYQPYWAARAGLLARAGDLDAADAAYEAAIGLAREPAVRRFLQRHRAELGARPGDGCAAGLRPPSRWRPPHHGPRCGVPGRVACRSLRGVGSREGRAHDASLPRESVAHAQPGPGDDPLARPVDQPAEHVGVAPGGRPGAVAAPARGGARGCAARPRGVRGPAASGRPAPASSRPPAPDRDGQHASHDGRHAIHGRGQRSCRGRDSARVPGARGAGTVGAVARAVPDELAVHRAAEHDGGSASRLTGRRGSSRSFDLTARRDPSHPARTPTGPAPGRTGCGRSAGPRGSRRRRRPDPRRAGDPSAGSRRGRWRGR